MIMTMTAAMPRRGNEKEEQAPVPQEPARQNPVFQAPDRVVMVRPHRFSPNQLTSGDNAFQTPMPASSVEESASAAYREVTGLVEQLRAEGIGVDLFEDTGSSTPDSVFPNNWFTTHSDGRIALYPMYAQNRRAERREDIIAHLSSSYHVTEVIDLSEVEQDSAYLEGTGAMVLDHVGRTAYASFSNRLTPTLFFRWCRDFGYQPVLFHATDQSGVSVYHTNVLMSVGTNLALVGSEMISSAYERQAVLESLAGNGRSIVELSEEQIRCFAGNILELTGTHGQVLAMSTTALGSLSPQQRETIEAHCRILAAEVPTIENAGGSVRCMLAGNYLAPLADTAA